MLHKMLIYKHGIDFSLVRRATRFPALFLEEEGLFTPRGYSLHIYRGTHFKDNEGFEANWMHCEAY